MEGNKRLSEVLVGVSEVRTGRRKIRVKLRGRIGVGDGSIVGIV